MRTCKAKGPNTSTSVASLTPPPTDPTLSDMDTNNADALNSAIDENLPHGPEWAPHGRRQAIGPGLGGPWASDASPVYNPSTSTTSGSTPASVSTSYPSSPSVSLDPDHHSDRTRSEGDGGGGGLSEDYYDAGIVPSTSPGWGSNSLAPWTPPRRQNTVDSVPASPSDNMIFRDSAADGPSTHVNTRPKFGYTKNMIPSLPTSYSLPTPGTAAPEGASVGGELYYPRRTQQGRDQAPPRGGRHIPVAQRIPVPEHLRHMLPSALSVPVLPQPSPHAPAVSSVSGAAAASGTTITPQSWSGHPFATHGSSSAASSLVSNLPTSSLPTSNSSHTIVPSNARGHSRPPPQPPTSGSRRGMGPGGLEGSHTRPHGLLPAPQLDQTQIQARQERVNYNNYDSNNSRFMAHEPYAYTQSSSLRPPYNLPEQQYEQGHQRSQPEHPQQDQYQYSGHGTYAGQQQQQTQDGSDRPASISILPLPEMMHDHSVLQYTANQSYQIGPSGQAPLSSSTPTPSASTTDWSSSAGGGSPIDTYSTASHRRAHPPPHSYQDPQNNDPVIGLEHTYNYGNFRRAPDNEPAIDRANDSSQLMYLPRQRHHFTTSSTSMGLHSHRSLEAANRQGHAAHAHAAPNVAGMADDRAGAAAMADGIGATSHGLMDDPASTYPSTQAAPAHSRDSAPRGEPQVQPRQSYYFTPGIPPQGDRRVYSPPQEHQREQDQHRFWPSSGGADPGPNTHGTNLSQGDHSAHTFDYGERARQSPRKPDGHSSRERTQEMSWDTNVDAS